MAAVTFDVPFVLAMMRLHEAQEMHQASPLADWIGGTASLKLCLKTGARSYGVKNRLKVLIYNM